MFSKTGAFRSQKSTKTLDAELNLTSFIDTLSVLVIFLIVAGINPSLIGALDLKQASGTTSDMTSDQKPILVVALEGDSVSYRLKNSKNSGIVRANLPANFAETSTIQKQIAKFKTIEANLDSAILLSAKSVKYDRIISVLTELKQQGIGQVGVSSL